VLGLVRCGVAGLGLLHSAASGHRGADRLLLLRLPGLGFYQGGFGLGQGGAGFGIA
jgi:hypothetical protein